MSWMIKVDLAALAAAKRLGAWWRKRFVSQGRHRARGLSTAQFVRQLQVDR